MSASLFTFLLWLMGGRYLRLPLGRQLWCWSSTSSP